MGTVNPERPVNEEIFSSSYIEDPWYPNTRRGGISVTICSTTKPFGLKGEVPRRNKLLMKDGEQKGGEQQDRDVDAIALMELFKGRAIVGIQQDKCYDEFLNYLAAGIDFERFDSFVLVFLTYSSSGGDTLDFKDQSVDMEDFLNRLKNIGSFAGKPKVVLMQADYYDMKTSTQSDQMRKRGVTVKKVKIPTDSDIITLVSKLPGNITRKRRIMTDGEQKDPSLLVKAFVTILRENWGRESQIDFLSLTTHINAKFKELFLTLEHQIEPDIPLVTSTLRKLLCI